MTRFPYVNKLNLLYWITILGLFTFMYQFTFLWMYGRFTAEGTYYSHGFLIPFVSAFLIWQKRETLKNIPSGSSSIGIALIVVALLIHIASNIFYVFFTSGFSIFILIFGISLFLFGGKRTTAILFPIMFLIFMFPIPDAAVNTIGFPMKMLVAILGSGVVSSLGLPVFQSGFHVETAKGVLLIDDPCSGIRSLVSFMALGALVGYLRNPSWKSRSLIFAFSVFLALLTNILRVSFLIFMANYYGVDAVSPGSLIHDLSGYAVFIIGTTLLLGFNRLME